jgi:hypothetical protein
MRKSMSIPKGIVRHPKVGGVCGTFTEIDDALTEDVRRDRRSMSPVLFEDDSRAAGSEIEARHSGAHGFAILCFDE